MKAYLSKVKLLMIITLMGVIQFSYAKDKDYISLEQASESIRKESKGQVLSATTNDYNGVKTHRIQVLTESGRVKVYQVPAFKKDTTKHYGNDQPPNNSNNYRNRKPNNNTRNNRNQTTKPSSNSRSNLRSNFRSNSRLNSRSTYDRNNTTIKQPSSSNGDTKKK